MIEDGTSRAIERALATQDYPRAAEIAAAAIAAGQSDAMLFRLVAWRSEAAGDLSVALDLLQRALALVPGEPTILTAIGTVLRKLGRFSEALPVLDAAVAKAPALAEAWLQRGFTFQAGGALEDAAENFHRAAALDPHSAAALAGFAAVAALLGYPEAVRKFAGRALAIDPGEPTAICALAGIDIEARDYPPAVAALESLTARRDLPGPTRTAALTLLGDALNGSGAVDGAFAAYVAAKAGFAADHAARFGPDSGTPTHRSIVERTAAAVARADPARWAATPAPNTADSPRGHIFLTGYPRSGTTLVENVLASAPGVEALEERPTLHAAERAFIEAEGGIDRLLNLDDAGLAEARAAYWRKVVDCGIDVPGKLVVDMDPLAGIRLPIIARLFPDARIIVMRRDPRDVVWSCFHTSFAASPAVYEFTTLERAARHYDATMRLMEQCFEVLPLSVHILRYDELVADFDPVTRALCDFTGIDWTPAMREFDKTARTRGVTTASVGQVRQGLFSGVGKWRRYAAHLEPVLPILQPWVERFGFAD